MSQFRKRPVVVEAVQYTGANHDEVDAFVAISPRATTWVPDHGLRIDTLEGSMMCDVGDWIIRGVQGEIYPCKPDIFAATYEAL